MSNVNMRSTNSRKPRSSCDNVLDKFNNEREVLSKTLNLKGIGSFQIPKKSSGERADSASRNQSFGKIAGFIGPQASVDQSEGVRSSENAIQEKYLPKSAPIKRKNALLKDELTKASRNLVLRNIEKIAIKKKHAQKMHSEKCNTVNKGVKNLKKLQAAKYGCKQSSTPEILNDMIEDIVKPNRGRSTAIQCCNDVDYSYNRAKDCEKTPTTTVRKKASIENAIWMDSCGSPESDDNGMDAMEFESNITEIYSHLTDNVPTKNERLHGSEELRNPNTSLIVEESMDVDMVESSRSSSADIFIVPDTNIWMGCIEIIQKLLNMLRIKIFVPWMVIQELDSACKIQGRKGILGRKAVKYVHNLLLSKNPSIRGQKASEASLASNQFKQMVADDSILQCALHLKNSGYDSILLTNDLNLMNKAVIHDIVATSSSSVFEAIESLRGTNHDAPLHFHRDFNTYMATSSIATATSFDFKEAKQILLKCLTHIISQQMKKDYGCNESEPINWLRMIKIKPPFSIGSALQCLLVHWTANFSILFRSPAESHVKILMELFNNEYMMTQNVESRKNWIHDICETVLALLNLITSDISRDLEVKKCKDIFLLGSNSDSLIKETGNVCFSS